VQISPLAKCEFRHPPPPCRSWQRLSYAKQTACTVLFAGLWCLDLAAPLLTSPPAATFLLPFPAAFLVTLPRLPLSCSPCLLHLLLPCQDCHFLVIPSTCTQADNSLSHIDCHSYLYASFYFLAQAASMLLPYPLLPLVTLL
jgi:hypothetical protein